MTIDRAHPSVGLASEPRLRRYLRTRATALAVLLCAVSVAGEFGRTHWLLDLASHFRPHYAAALLGAILALIVLRAGVLIVAACVLSFGVQVRAVWPTAATLGAVTGTESARPVRILLANVYTGNRDHAAVARLLRAEAPDVVVLQEVDAVWLEALGANRTEYPHRVEEVRADNFGLVLWSRFPLSAARIERLDASGVPTIVARVAAPMGACQLIAAHPLPPAGGRRSRLRDEGLAGLARLAAAQAVPVVVVGDLNCTPWSPRFVDLLHDGRLRDTGAEEILRPTWPAALGVFGIPLDHCLVGPGVRVHARRIGPRIGSDHRPLIVDFSLTPGC